MEHVSGRALLATSVAVAVALCLCSTALASTIDLRWDGNPEPDITGYKVFVGTSSGQYDQIFTLGQQTTFSYTSAEPGKRYYFAVAAVAGSAVSEKSAEVVGVGPGTPVGGAPTPPTASPWPYPDPPLPPDQTLDPWLKNPYYWGILGRRSPAPAAAAEGRTCLAASTAPSCFQYAQVGPVLSDARSVSVADHNLLFFVEAWRSIRVIAGNALTPDPVYTVEGDVRVEQVVVDPQFARTQTVFVSESTTARDGTRSMTILRTRYVGGALGEAAAVVSGLPMAPQASAPFVVTATGLIYVAVPRIASAQSSAYSSRVLAFNADGRAAGTNSSGSPVIAEGLADPVALWVGANESELSLVGHDDQGRSVVEQMTVSDDASAGAVSYRALDGEPAAAVGAGGFVTVGANGTARAVAPGPASSIYVTVESASSASGESRYAIVALQPY